MPNRRRPAVPFVLGLALVAAGVACWLSGADGPLHAALRLAGADRGVRDLLWFTALGGLAVQGPLALAATALLLARGRRRDAGWLVAAVVSGRLAVEGAKLLVRRPRPPVADRLEVVTSWSFPSSHSAGTMLTCLLLAALSGGGRRAYAVAVAAAVAIGWSRIALGVHWPGDVLAGWGAGLAWAALANKWRPAALTRPHATQGEPV